MDDKARRAAKAAFAERKAEWAICVVRIGAARWVTVKPDAAALDRRLGFSLRSGGAGAPGMREAFAGAGEVRVDVVERLDDTLSPMARDRLAQKRLAHWAETLGATLF